MEDLPWKGDHAPASVHHDIQAPINELTVVEQVEPCRTCFLVRKPFDPVLPERAATGIAREPPSHANRDVRLIDDSGVMELVVKPVGLLAVPPFRDVAEGVELRGPASVCEVPILRPGTDDRLSER